MGRERRAVCAARCHCAVCVVRGARGAGELCEWGCVWGGVIRLCVRGTGYRVKLCARGPGEAPAAAFVLPCFCEPYSLKLALSLSQLVEATESRH